MKLWLELWRLAELTGSSLLIRSKWNNIASKFVHRMFLQLSFSIVHTLRQHVCMIRERLQKGKLEMISNCHYALDKTWLHDFRNFTILTVFYLLFFTHREQLNLVAQLEDYKSQCLHDRSKQTVSIIVYSMKSLIGQYCKTLNTRRTTELINSARCANEANLKYNTCNQDYIDLLMAVENSKDSKQQLVQLCW